MPTKIVRKPEHVKALADILRKRKLPLTVTWTQGAPRTKSQNRLAQRWFSDIAMQMGDRTHENVRAECKLMFGVPIMRAANTAYDLSYSKVFDSLTYEESLQAIEVLQLPVTRFMLVPQMNEFMTKMSEYWTRNGVRLTDPEAFKYEQEFQD
jgi:hypothetical protein